MFDEVCCLVGPVIKQTQRVHEVLIERSVSFMCKATGNPHPVIEWYRYGKKVSVGSLRTEILQNGSVLSLTNVQERDGGDYVCRAKNRASDNGRHVVLIDSANFSLSVIGKAVGRLIGRLISHNSTCFISLVPPRVMTAREEVIVEQGKSEVLVCDVRGTPSPSIVWLKDGVRISASDRVESERLTIESARLVDDGEYTCVATNKGGSNNITIQLIVHCKIVIKCISHLVTFVTTTCVPDSPSLTKSLDDKDVLVHSTITWSCSASSLPAATLSWEKDDVPLVSNHRLSISSDGTQLTVSSVKTRDAGRYNCIARNYLGDATASAHLFVIGNSRR